MQSDSKSYLSLFKDGVIVGRHKGADSGKFWRFTVIDYFIFWPSNWREKQIYVFQQIRLN